MSHTVNSFVLRRGLSKSYTPGKAHQFQIPLDVTVESLSDSVMAFAQENQYMSVGEDIRVSAYQVPPGMEPTQDLARRWAAVGKFEKEPVEPSRSLDAPPGATLGFFFILDPILLFHYASFQKNGSSYRYINTGCVPGTPLCTAETFQEHAKANITNRGLDVHKPLVWQAPEPLNLDNPEELENRLNGGYLGQCKMPFPREALARIEYIVIVAPPPFTIDLWEKVRGVCQYIGSGNTGAWPKDTIQTIRESAEKRAKTILQPARLSLVDITMYEPRRSYEEAYINMVKQKDPPTLLDNDFPRRGSKFTILSPEDNVKTISCKRLVCVYSTKREFKIPYVLFNRESKPFEFSARGYVEVSSDLDMRTVWNDANTHLRVPRVEGKLSIEVYKPTEAFTKAYRQPPENLCSLKLEEKDLQVGKCVKLDPGDTLSNYTAEDVLIVVFDLQPTPTLSLQEKFFVLDVATKAPSLVSSRSIYQGIQGKSGQRILDDRPSADHLLPPMSLLYDGFGIFDDVYHERRKATEESDIHETQLWEKVDEFAKRMAGFHDDEAKRAAIMRDYLEQIFNAHEDSTPVGIAASRIGASNMTSDGHIRGEHGAIVFCAECKNELTGISSEPSVELVSYIASSFKEQLGKQKYVPLFDGWRVPALGMTQIGAFVQFFGVLMLTPQMRVVPLTPMLPLAIPIGDERSGRELFLAFKAASILVARIQDDAKRFSKNPPPRIPLELRTLPNITAITSVDNPSVPITFKLLRRYDTEVTYRNLYHAQKANTNEEIYVKFTQRYSYKLHTFCAKKQLAPQLLGYEKLPGGWIGLAMEKIDTDDVMEIKSFPELDRWKRDIRQLVDEFHKEDLVHGDLRLANFIFTKESPRRMLLVDFDWGGKEEEVKFPCGKLNEQLYAEPEEQRGRLPVDRPIKKGDDDRVLAVMFEELDKIAANATHSGGVGAA